MQDMAETQKLMVTALSRLENENPNQVFYDLLYSELIPLSPSDKMTELIVDTVATGHASTHNKYTLEIENILEFKNKAQDL